MKKMKMSDERDSDGHRRPASTSLGNCLLIFDFGVARNYAESPPIYISVQY
jgi:hypothetical protein